MKRKAKIEAVPAVASIADHQAAKTAKLTELETARLQVEVANYNALKATVANLQTQLQTATVALRQQAASLDAKRNEILAAYGFDPTMKIEEVPSADGCLTLRQQA